MAIVADTSFLIDMARKHAGAFAVADWLADEGQLLLIPSLVVGEYLAGCTDVQAGRETLHRAGEVLPFTEADAIAGAEVARERLQAGTFPGWVDAFLIGFARNRGDLTILTANPCHFPEDRVKTYR